MKNDWKIDILGTAMTIKVKKVLDYVLVDRFVEQYIEDCCASKEYKFDSDHLLLKTTLNTPTSKHARWRNGLKGINPQMPKY